VVWSWDSDPFGATAPNENPSGLGTFSFNLRFPGQYYDQETGLNYNMARDYDPAVGRYVESDPLGLKAGVNTYAYVRDSPISYNDPTGLEASTVQCDGNGNYEIVNLDKNSCTSECTKAHEQSHLDDLKLRFGAGSCRNKPKGYQPADTWTFKWKTECKAYGVEATCLKKSLNDCQCKKDAANALRQAEAGISYYCNTTPPRP
jgi:RHS repeat-associated protein